MIIPRIVVRLGARRIRTNGRVGISKSVEIDLTNPQAKAERYMRIQIFALTKLNSIINCIKGIEMPLGKKLNEKVIAS